MNMPFANPVAGAGGVLVLSSIHSPNFSMSGKTGWAIFQNGDAYFWNLTAEGSVTANTVLVSGTGDGVFVYDGAPGEGTLVVAIASAAGTDAYGNSYSGPGIVISAPGGSGANEIQIRPDLNAMLIYA